MKIIKMFSIKILPLSKRYFVPAIVFFAIVSLTCCILIRRNSSSSNSWRVLQITCENIQNLPIDTLKNLRFLTKAEKESLYKDLHFESIFSIKKSCEAIKMIKDPYIILWFSDHLGNISKKCLEWYVKNLFTPLHSMGKHFYSLIDLTAWKYLSLDSATLMLDEGYKSFLYYKTMSMSGQGCPLFYEQCKTLIAPEDSCARVMRASDFFIWLANLDGSINELSGNIAYNNYRIDKRDNTNSFTLADIGFSSSFLADVVPCLNNSLLDIDHSQVFPILQYLEGLYYAYKIAEDHSIQNNNSSPCSIVFLLPNKEFTYYIVNNEKKLFDTFRKNVEEILNKYLKTSVLHEVSIHFIPFAYGDSFYSAPFDEQGPFLNQQEISSSLLLHLL